MRCLSGTADVANHLPQHFNMQHLPMLLACHSVPDATRKAPQAPPVSLWRLAVIAWRIQSYTTCLLHATRHLLPPGGSCQAKQSGCDSLHTCCSCFARSEWSARAPERLCSLPSRSATCLWRECRSAWCCCSRAACSWLAESNWVRRLLASSLTLSSSASNSELRTCMSD